MDTLAHLRGWWASRQGLLPATAPKTIEACLKRAGWLPTSGAPTAYLSIRARLPGASRAGIDRAAMDGVQMTEVPGLAGRPHLLVPAADVPLVLRLHLAGFQALAASTFKRDGVSAAALRSVSAQVSAALEECPLSTGDLRKTVTHRDAGVLLTVALNELMLRGVVRRFPSNGQIDSNTYQFELRHPDDRPDLDAVGDAETVVALGVERFLRHHGPATVDEILWWTDLTKGAIRKALERIDATVVAVPGWTTAKNEVWLLRSDVAAWKSFTTPPNDRIAFLPYRDPFVHLRRTPSLLTRTKTAPIVGVHYGKQRAATLAEVTDLVHHTISCGDELVGVWEYDPKAKAVVTRLWQPTTKLKRRVSDAAEGLTTFIREDLGDAKLSAVDPPEKRAVRLAFCRQR
jgi:hypothetical protein